MKASLLALRVSRRAIAAVSLDDETLGFADARHLTSRRGKAVDAAIRYVSRLLDQAAPSAVVIDAPAKGGSATMSVAEAIADLLTRRSIVHTSLPTADILLAYGMPALRSRRELRAVAAALWAQLPTTCLPSQ